MEQGRDDEALQTLSRLRRRSAEEPLVQLEYLEIKAEVLFTRETRAIQDDGLGGFRRLANNYIALVASWPKFKRLAVGCLVMFYQQFMVNCYYLF